jgi:hypothetical protein
MKKNTLALAAFILAVAATVFASQHSPSPVVAHDWPLPTCPPTCPPQ